MNDQFTKKIKMASKYEVDEYLMAAMDRKRELYPDWELIYMAIPKNNEEDRRATIRFIVDMLERGEAQRLADM